MTRGLLWCSLLVLLVTGAGVTTRLYGMGLDRTAVGHAAGLRTAMTPR
jgi:hypothetical protein